MRRPDQRGETLVEVVMALGILSLVLVSSYALATGTFRLGRGAGERTQAVNYLQEQAEALRTYRNQTPTWADFQTSMTNNQNQTFCMQQITEPASGKKLWKPSTDNCSRDNITISIKATPVVTEQIVGQQYNYELEAEWYTGRQKNNVRLTTKLVRQN